MTRIQYYTYDTTLVDALEVVHDLQWWLRPVRRLLAKSGYEIGQWNPSITYKTITCETRDVANLIGQQVMDIRRQTGKQPKAVMLGRKQQLDLFKTTVEYPMALVGGRDYRNEIFGLTIILHPLIDGIVVVPET